MNIRTSRKSFFFSSKSLHTMSLCGWSSDVCSSDLIKARTTSQMNACINNLRQVDGAEQQWALETKRSEERRVGKECRSWWRRNHVKKNDGGAGGTLALSYTLVAVGGPTKPDCIEIS